MSKMNVTLTPNNINLSRVSFSSTISKEEINKLAENSNKIEDKSPSIKQDVNLKESSFALRDSLHADDNFIYFSDPTMKELNISINKDIIINTPDGKFRIPTNSTEISAKDLEPYRDIIQNATKIIIPDGIKEIGPEAFVDYKNLQEISLPESLTKISWWAFAGCKSLRTINFPDSVTQIGEWAFYNCKSLTELVLPPNFKSVGNRAFKNCDSLKRILCPEETIFEERAISDCKGLEVYIYHKR